MSVWAFAEVGGPSPADPVDDGVWSVYFYDVLLARLDEREMTLFT